jgi:hypothetical protein
MAATARKARGVDEIVLMRSLKLSINLFTMTERAERQSKAVPA